MGAEHVRTLAIVILPVGSGFVAATRVGGMTIRTGRAETEYDAITALFRMLGNAIGDAGIAIDLWIADNDIASTLDRLLAEVTETNEHGS